MTGPPRRRIGRSKLEAFPLALGGNVFGWTIREKESFRVLDAFVAAGGNLIDTADVYSAWVDGHAGGESETILGRWLKSSGQRENVLLATKVGMEMGSGTKGLAPDYIRSSVRASLERLGTDRIDLYQAHLDDPSTPLDRTLGAFAELVDDGLVRAIGASNYGGARLREALTVSRDHGWPRFESVQPRYNLYDREEFERDLAPLSREEGLSVLTYSSLASGFLTGKYRAESDFGKSPRGARMPRFLNERGLRIVDALTEVGRAHAVRPATIALAWLLARPTVTAPIASATSPAQLDELLEATRIELGRDEVEMLDRASAPT